MDPLARFQSFDAKQILSSIINNVHDLLSKSQGAALNSSKSILLFPEINHIWAPAWQKPTKWHVRSASAQFDQSLRLPPKTHWVLSYTLSEQRSLIRLSGCPGWSESLPGAQVSQGTTKHSKLYVCPAMTWISLCSHTAWSVFAGCSLDNQRTISSSGGQVQQWFCAIPKTVLNWTTLYTVWLQYMHCWMALFDLMLLP